MASALASLDAEFDALYTKEGRPSIAPERLDGKQAAALAGLAPMSRQPGRWQGQERIQGGRSSVRHALFMPALSAIQHNRPAKARFEQLVATGKPRKVALTAVMRKLIVTANALLRDGRKWSEIHA